MKDNVEVIDKNLWWIFCLQAVAGPQIYSRGPRTYTIFIPAWGSKWGLWVLPAIKNNHGSAGVCVCYPHVHVKWHTPREDHDCIWFVFVFVYVVDKNPGDLQMEPHGWRHHYTGRYRRSGISGVYQWAGLILRIYPNHLSWNENCFCSKYCKYIQTICKMIDTISSFQD